MLSSRQNSTTLRSRDTAQAVAAFMSRVYLWMMVGIAISGMTAYVVANTPNLINAIMHNTILFYGLVIFQLVAVVALSGWIQRMSIGVASTVYALYATLVGLTFSVLFLVYTASSISSAFFTTSFAFAGLSLIGYTTKRDLGPIGTFCMMALFGLIGMMLLSFFIPALMGSGMQLAMTIAGLIIFAGLTAYDTQRIKSTYFQFTTGDQARKGAIFGALVLYLDFINLFINILRLMGDRR